MAGGQTASGSAENMLLSGFLNTVYGMIYSFSLSPNCRCCIPNSMTGMYDSGTKFSITITKKSICAIQNYKLDIIIKECIARYLRSNDEQSRDTWRGFYGQ
jgi:hypothetical protein